MEKRSHAWKYFSICETDESKGQCSIRKTIISRGGSNTKSYSTSALNNHLKNKHPDEYESITVDKRALFIAYYMCVLVNSFLSKLFEFEPILPNTDARYSVFGRILKLPYSVQPY